MPSTSGLWLLLLVAIPLPLTVWIAAVALYSPASPDWRIFVEAGRHAWSGANIYSGGPYYYFRYSPVFAYAMPLVAWMGPNVWRALHIAAALALPTRRMRLLALSSFAFWMDLQEGNVMVFLLLIALAAVRGSTVWSGAFLALTLLIPRPLMIPIAVWLLWREPSLRRPFAALFVLQALFVFAAGYADDWTHVLLASGAHVTSPLNLSPSRYFGATWLVVGIPLAGYLAAHGKIGLAGLTSSPYLLPYYLLMGLVEAPEATSKKRPSHHGPWAT